MSYHKSLDSLDLKYIYISLALVFFSGSSLPCCCSRRRIWKSECLNVVGNAG